MAPMVINPALLTRSRRSTPGWLVSGTIAAIMLLGITLVAMKSARGRSMIKMRNGPVSLLGYDPYGSVSHAGKRDDLASSWGDEEEVELPHWATDWPSDAEAPCDPGTQCIGGVANPLGILGKWVMQSTSPQDHAKREWLIRHNCLNLPGWAVEECYAMREKEAALNDKGQLKDPEEEQPPATEEAVVETSEAPAAKKSRTTLLAMQEKRGKKESMAAQKSIDALVRKGGKSSSHTPMHRQLRGRERAYGGGAQAAEESGEVVVVPAKDVTMA